MVGKIEKGVVRTLLFQKKLGRDPWLKGSKWFRDIRLISSVGRALARQSFENNEKEKGRQGDYFYIISVISNKHNNQIYQAQGSWYRLVSCPPFSGDWNITCLFSKVAFCDQTKLMRISWSSPRTCSGGGKTARKYSSWSGDLIGNDNFPFKGHGFRLTTLPQECVV